MAEAAIASLLASFGYQLYFPFGHNTTADFVIDTTDGPKRVQCKSGWKRDGALVFNAANANGKDYSDCDLLMVWCPALADRPFVFEPKLEKLPRRPMFRWDPPANGQTKNIKWAQPYLMRIQHQINLTATASGEPVAISVLEPYVNYEEGP